MYNPRQILTNWRGRRVYERFWVYMKPFELPMKQVYESARAVQDYAHDFLTNRNLNLFSLIRCYNDGSIVPITSSPDATRDWLRWNSLALYPLLPDPYQHMYAYFWEEIVSQQSLSILYKYSLYQGINLIFRYTNFIDLVCFAMPGKESQGKLFYFNHLPQLQEFYRCFLKHKADLIAYYENKRIDLPKERQVENLNDLVLSNPDKKYYLKEGSGLKYITEMECVCINLQRLGYSHKDLSVIFDQKEELIKNCIALAKRRIGHANADELLKNNDLYPIFERINHKTC